MENYLFFVKIITYFIIYSFFGWILESVYKSILERKIINSGFLHGPFCPIYGFGAVFMFLCLNNFKNNLILLFIISFFTLSIWEYIVGFLLEKFLHTKYWDYSKNKFNISGRVCLLNSFFWGVLGVVFTRFVHPFITEKIEILSTKHLLFFTTTLSIIMIIDFIISIIKVKNINIKFEKLKDITNTIKEKLEEENTKTINKESLQQVIEELKQKQIVIKRKLTKQINRLKKAFPTMKSEAIEKINEFLKEKKESIKAKEEIKNKIVFHKNKNT